MKNYKGFTLIELMVAVVTGIFLVTSLMNLFITMNRSVTLSDAMSQNQETGRFAMDYLTKQVRQAGYTSSNSASATKLDPIFMPPECTLEKACTENNPDTIRGDRIAIQFFVSQGETIRACDGKKIVGPRRIANVFWVSADTGSDRELRCRVVDTENNKWIDDQKPVSIVNNVELMEMQLGIAENITDREAATYINLDTFNPTDKEVDASFIRSIKLGVLTTSATADSPTQTDIDERQYVILDSPILTFNDGTLRSIFTNTIELPNAIESAHQSSTY